MHYYFEEFKFCPRCGVEFFPEDYHVDGTFFKCHACTLIFFQNNKPSAVLVIPEQNNPENILMLERGEDPNKGKWDYPGGFLHCGEKLYEAGARELEEELGIQPQVMELFWAEPFAYEYKGVIHMTLNCFMLTEPIALEAFALNTNENKSIKFYHVDDIINGLVNVAGEINKGAAREYKQKFLEE